MRTSQPTTTASHRHPKAPTLFADPQTPPPTPQVAQPMSSDTPKPTSPQPPFAKQPAPPASAQEVFASDGPEGVRALTADPKKRLDFDGDPSKLVRTARPIDRENPHPIYCVWEITLKCDLGCKHCGSRAGHARTEELSTQECLDVVHQLADIGVREVTLIGGEAYMRDDWHLIAKEITRCGMVCGMTTGARNLDQRRVDLAVEAGLRTISVSLDGLEKTHDALRGSPGAWKAATEACRRIAASPIRLANNTQINRLSMPELPAIADLLIELGSKAWQIQLTVAMGRAADRPDMLPQPYDLLELFPLLVWIKQTKLIPGGVQLFPGNNIGYFGPYEHLLRYGGDRGAHWSGCSAGLWTLGLEADGKIKGCPSLPSKEYTGGNIRDMAIAEAVANSREIAHIRVRTRDDLWGFCNTCYYGDVCRAGCTWTSHCLLGRPGNNPYCIHRALQYETQGLRERIVKVEAAPGEPFDNGRFEIVVEQLPELLEDDQPSILGQSLPDLLNLKTDAGSLWERDHIKSILKRA
jgi:radical SAM protein with 4Fe4S-binding SPASM domain